jgi:hypothetical protein
MGLDDARPLIQRACAADVAEHGAEGPGPLDGTPAALDPALWFWAKWGCRFSQAAGEKLPIGAPCAPAAFAHSCHGSGDCGSLVGPTIAT